jgi:hypothetical protein
MSPDPILDKLARFTPNGSAIDQAALLFEAGRASARTPLGWKFAVAALLAANLGWLSVLTFHSNPRNLPGTNAVPDRINAPLPEPEGLQPLAKRLPQTSDEPRSYRELISVSDPEQFPRIEPLHNPVPSTDPLTPRSASRGELDG